MRVAFPEQGLSKEQLHLIGSRFEGNQVLEPAFPNSAEEVAVEPSGDQLPPASKRFAAAKISITFPYMSVWIGVLARPSSR